MYRNFIYTVEGLNKEMYFYYTIVKLKKDTNRPDKLGCLLIHLKCTHQSHTKEMPEPAMLCFIISESTTPNKLAVADDARPCMPVDCHILTLG